MSELLITIISGVIVAIIVAWFGIGGTKHVTIHGSPVRKTGKWIIFFSIIAIFGGLAWAGHYSLPQGGLDFSKHGTVYGIALASFGLLALIVGKIVAWFQKS